MLFESQSKADNFIKFNSAEILEDNKKAPIRSYYCVMCNGWHVTSNPSADFGESMDSKDQSMLEQIIINSRIGKKVKVSNIEEASFIQGKLSQAVANAESYLRMFDFDKVEELLDVCEIYYEDLEAYDASHTFGRKLYGMSLKLRRIADLCETLIADEDGMAQFLSMEKPSEEEKKVMEILENWPNISKFKQVIENKELLINSDDDQMVSDILEMCDNLIVSCTNFTKNIRKKFRAQLEKIPIQRKKRMAKKRAEMLLLNPRMVEPGKAPEKPSDDYKAELISLIEKLEQIKSLFEKGDISACEEIIELCDLLIVDMPWDENVALINSQLDNWKEKIG